RAADRAGGGGTAGAEAPRSRQTRRASTMAIAESARAAPAKRSNRRPGPVPRGNWRRGPLRPGRLTPKTSRHGSGSAAGEQGRRRAPAAEAGAAEVAKHRRDRAERDRRMLRESYPYYLANRAVAAN